VLKVEQEESLLDPNEAPPVLELQVAILRHVVGVKLAEVAAAEQETARRQKKDRILSILASKQDESLIACSEEELAKMLEDI